MVVTVRKEDGMKGSGARILSVNCFLGKIHVEMLILFVAALLLPFNLIYYSVLQCMMNPDSEQV